MRYAYTIVWACLFIYIVIGQAVKKSGIPKQVAAKVFKEKFCLFFPPYKTIAYIINK